MGEVKMKSRKILVYVAPTLDLLNQNASKILLHLRGAGFTPKILLNCSKRSWNFEEWHSDNDNVMHHTLRGDEAYDFVQRRDRDIFIATTLHSYPLLEEYCVRENEKIIRITDELLSVIPNKEYASDKKNDAKVKKIWTRWKNTDILEKSYNFDAFEQPASKKGGWGSDHEAVGPKIIKVTPEETNLAGATIPIELRVLTLDKELIDENSHLYGDGWEDKDKFNFNGQILAMQDLIDDKTFEFKKQIGFMHNAPICDDYTKSLKKYFEKKHPLEFYGAIRAETTDRGMHLRKYTEAKHGVINNYMTLGKGIDDDKTPSVFMGRNSVSVYGAHAIHRPCRSDAREWGLPPSQHVKKPYGIIYVMMINGEEELEKRAGDLREMIKMLQRSSTPFKVKWIDNPQPKNKKPKQIPGGDDRDPFDDIPDPTLRKILRVDRERMWEEVLPSNIEQYSNDDLLDAIETINEKIEEKV